MKKSLERTKAKTAETSLQRIVLKSPKPCTDAGIAVFQAFPDP